MIFQPLDPRKGGRLLLLEGPDQLSKLKQIEEALSNPEKEQSSFEVPEGIPEGLVVKKSGSATIYGPPGKEIVGTPYWASFPTVSAMYNLASLNSKNPGKNWAFCNTCQDWHVVN